VSKKSAAHSVFSWPIPLAAVRRLASASALMKGVPAGGVPSKVVEQGLRRAGAGLIAAAWVQVIVCLIVARSGYPALFLLLASPLLFLATVAGVVMVLTDERPAPWLVGLCALFAAYSLLATWCVYRRYTGGLNAAEPLIGLGAFAAAMAGDLWSRLAAGALIAIHRGALILARTGLRSEHVVLLEIECGSLVAAIVGSAIVRHHAKKLDKTAERQWEWFKSAAAERSEHHVLDEWQRLLHDLPVNRLWQVAQGYAVDSAEFRTGCAEDAELLRGEVAVFESERDLARALQTLVPRFEQQGLHVSVVVQDDFWYPASAQLVTAVKRSAQQALENVRRHSGQDRAEVRLAVAEAKVQLEIRDRGRGSMMSSSLAIAAASGTRSWNGCAPSAETPISAGTRTIRVRSSRSGGPRRERVRAPGRPTAVSRQPRRLRPVQQARGAAALAAAERLHVEFDSGGSGGLRRAERRPDRAELAGVPEPLARRGAPGCPRRGVRARVGPVLGRGGAGAVRRRPGGRARRLRDHRHSAQRHPAD
jgi:hypothetical protein